MASGTLEFKVASGDPHAAFPARSPRLPAWIPYVLAVLFALLALRGLGSHNIVETDAARHAMNGAFVHDLLLSGHIAHPIDYGREYYGRMPALSMPYHPPMFPIIEALFYFLFGVHLVTARVVVAVAVGACAVLLYRLVEATHNSSLLALCVTVSTLSLWHSQLVATDVMLEYPALAFALAALCRLRDPARGYPLGRALLFALLGAVAVWTKQFAVFLLAVPPLYFLATGYWRLLFTKSLWISSALFALAVKALMMLSLPFNQTGVGPSMVPLAPRSIWWVMNHNILYYGQVAARELNGWPGLFGIGAMVLLAWAAWRGAWKSLHIELYLAWIVSIVAVLMVVGARSERYLFFVFPPILAVAFSFVLRGSEMLLGARRAWPVPAAMAAAWFVAGLLFQPEFLHGPAEAAAIVAQTAPDRVLYGGDADGNFIFALRELDPQLQDSVIPGEKLPAAVLAPAAFEDFCHRYAVNWVVLEDTGTPRPWSDLMAAPSPSMRLERTLPLSSSRTRWKGSIRVYRFLSAAARPQGGLALPIARIHAQVEARH